MARKKKLLNALDFYRSAKISCAVVTLMVVVPIAKFLPLGRSQGSWFALALLIAIPTWLSWRLFNSLVAIKCKKCGGEINGDQPRRDGFKCPVCGYIDDTW